VTILMWGVGGIGIFENYNKPKSDIITPNQGAKIYEHPKPI